MSTSGDKRRKLSERVQGHLRRFFITDYHLLRMAGLTRRKAMAVCIGKYVN